MVFHFVSLLLQKTIIRNIKNGCIYIFIKDLTFHLYPCKIHNVAGMGNQNVTMNVRLAQLDRAFGYGPKGREFESSNAREGKPRKYNVYEVFLLL